MIHTFILNYDVCLREYNQVVGGTSRSRDIEAKRRIRRYFAHVVNGVSIKKLKEQKEKMLLCLITFS